MKNTTRREFLSKVGTTTVAIPLASLFPFAVNAADKVDPEDPQAKALQYVHESPKEGELCTGCQLYSDSDEEGWGNCAIFPGKLVAADGWCASWVKKAG